jgi:hypothetical protein
MKFVLLHEAKNDDGIKAFFYEVWELYLKVSPPSRIAASAAACQMPADHDEPLPHRPHPNPKHSLRHEGEGQCEEVLVTVSKVGDKYRIHREASLAATPLAHNGLVVEGVEGAQARGAAITALMLR